MDEHWIMPNTPEGLLDTRLQAAYRVWCQWSSGVTVIEDQHGKTIQLTLPSGRWGVVHLPTSLATPHSAPSPCKYPVVVFYHGVGGFAWDVALRRTQLRELANEE